MDNYLKTTFFLILTLCITLSSSSTTTKHHPLSFILLEQQPGEPLLETLSIGVGQGLKEKTKLPGDEKGYNDNITVVDLIHEFTTSNFQHLIEEDHSPLALNTSVTHSRHVRNVDIRLEPNSDRTTNFRLLHGTDSSSNFMSVPREMLQQSFQTAQDGWLTRQRSIETMSMKSSSGSDPRSPIGTAYAFSAPNQQSLALSNSSTLLEIASRAFMKNMNSEAGIRQKRQLSNTFFDSNSNVMSERIMHVNVNPFFSRPDMPDMSCGRDEAQTCDRNSPLRTMSGVCNNLRNPNWGRAVITLDRMLPPAYGDGISAPKTHSVTGQLLPSPRYVSSTVHIDASHLSQRHTLLLMQYGQFLDHDITFTPVHKGPNGILNCRDCSSTRQVHPECWPIQVPFGDTYYPARQMPSGNPYCIPFTRSLPGQQRLGPREQINQNSAYIDNSQIYGENMCKSIGLRSSGGYLNATFPAGGKVLMPQTNTIGECKSKSGFCFQAGDSRASEQPALVAVHTIFLREHNRLVDGLRHINPHWNEEKLYQQARRILTATSQHLIYNEFLPRIVGANMMNAYELTLETTSYYDRYDSNCAAATYNEFATAAFRFGHSLIRPQVPRMNDHYHGMNPTIQLREGFFNSDILMKPYMIDEINRGLLAEPMEQLDPFVTNEITNHLFEDKTKAFSGLDLVSLNLQRGRDHGLQGYNAYRDACHLKQAHVFEDLASEIPTDVIERLRTVYPHVDDIDLFTGSLVERPVTGGLVGPTMACMIGNQFRRLRKCDRFWYETSDPVIQFSPQQLAEIRKVTVAKVFCENFDIPSDIQKAAFDAPHNVLNPRIPCDRLPTLNLEAWRDGQPVLSQPLHPAPYVASLPLYAAPPPIPTPYAPLLPVPQQPTSYASLLPPSPLSQYCNIGSASIPVGGSGMSSPCTSCICTLEGTKCASLRIVNCAQMLRQNRKQDVVDDPICNSQCSHVLNKASPLQSHSRFRFFKKSYDTETNQ